MSVGFCLSSIPGRAVALWGHAALVPGQFLVSGGAAAFAGRLRPSEFLPGQSRAARSPFGVMPRRSRDNFCLSQAARSPWLVALRTPYGAISCFWEVLGRSGGALASPPAGNFFVWGGRRAALTVRPCPLIFVFRRGSIPRRSWRAGAPWFMVSAWGRACTFARFPGCVQAGIALPSGARPGTSNTKTFP